MGGWFETQKDKARQMKSSDLRRFAATAKLEGVKDASGKDTGERCNNCFCCAAESVLLKERGDKDVKFFVARQQGALGIPTQLVTAVDVDDFHKRFPKLELLAAANSFEEARSHFTSMVSVSIQG